MALFRDLAEAASLAARDKVRVRIDENRARAVLGLQPREEDEADAAKAPDPKAPAKAPEPKA